MMQEHIEGDKIRRILNIYNWWDDDIPVDFFSAAGIKLPPYAPVRDRTIASAIVECLTGRVAKTDTHKRGPKNCPLYYYPDRSFDLLSSKQQFDEKCRSTLMENISE
jgi:hypothetical protein